jgi:hypothetical protein
MDYDEMVSNYEAAAAEAELRANDEAQLAEAMQYAVEEEMPGGGGEGWSLALHSML